MWIAVVMKVSYSDTVEIRATSTAMDIYINGVHQEANKTISQFHKGLHCNVILDLFCVVFFLSNILLLGFTAFVGVVIGSVFMHPFSCATMYRMFGEHIISSVYIKLNQIFIK